MLQNNAALKSIVEELWLLDELGKTKQGATFFITGLNRVFNEFKMLSPTDIEQLKEWFRSNNDIEKCCSNHPDVSPIRYDQLCGPFSNLVIELESFFKNLYSHNFLNLDIIQSKIGSVSDHYLEFVRENDEDICPFCGITR